jgi:acetaldehyde dehydrogenase / alcohol dehydrogenase
VLGVVRAESADRGIEAARAVVRLGGAGHSAAVHSRDPRVIMRYGVRVPVLRVAVNVGNSTGSAGLGTNLAPSMTLGTGFVGRSSIGENLEPRHLVNWTRVAYNADPGVPFDDFAAIAAWAAPAGPVPGYPHASNLPGAGPAGGPPMRDAADSDGAGSDGAADDAVAAELSDGAGAGPTVAAAVREQLRALIIEELEQLIKR